MSIIPRKNETEAAVAILEAEIPLLDGEGNPVVDDSGAPVLVPAYDDAASMAKALVRAIGTELAKREAYLIIPPDGALAWGPYYTSAQAVRAWEKEMGPAIAELMQVVSSQGIGPAGPWLSHHLRMAPDVFDFEVAVPVLAPVTPTGRVTRA